MDFRHRAVSFKRRRDADWLRKQREEQERWQEERATWRHRQPPDYVGGFPINMDITVIEPGPSRSLNDHFINVIQNPVQAQSWTLNRMESIIAVRQWAIFEEIGIAIINDYAVAKITVSDPAQDADPNS